MKNYDITITLNSPQGQQQLKLQVPENHMQCCPCGCDLFDLKYRCIHVKPPLIGMDPVAVSVQVYACSKCGYELSPLTPTKEAFLGEKCSSTR